jgi:thymidylate synthase ThyX
MSDGYECKVLADSIGDHDIRITSVEVRFPRIILSQVRTYGMLSYSVRSSRAVPTKTLLDEVLNEPFVPKVWRKVQKGMAAGEVLDLEAHESVTNKWLGARIAAYGYAKTLAEKGVAKEHVNRLLEPWSWSWAVVTGTDVEWAWLFSQRCADDAQPEFRTLANLIRDSFAASIPTPLEVGQWHIAYRDTDDCADQQSLFRSAARCARVSYKPFDGGDGLTAELARADKLQAAGHWSPFEHQAMCCATRAYRAKLAGWMSFRTRLGR